jgi:hypothetical protein
MAAATHSTTPSSLSNHDACDGGVARRDQQLKWLGGTAVVLPGEPGAAYQVPLICVWPSWTISSSVVTLVITCFTRSPV